MTDTPKVIVVHGDPRAADGVRLGFEREGMAVLAGDVDAVVPALEHAAVVIAGANGVEQARDLIVRLVAAGAARGAPPVLYVGNGVSRAQALSAGATAVMSGPAFVRDIVTIGRILAGRRPGNRSVMDGDLGDSFGVFYLVRALAAIGATGTLLMLRGLRRGEIRFFEGEVTSAQVGGLHGQGALHQLLLWTEARFELRDEPVVRRQQIPMSSDELLIGAERFLIDLRSASGVLSPAAVYEHDGEVMSSYAKALPTEVHGVLRLFDGHRTVADALEDSPYRVFETLRIAERAAQVGILRRREAVRARAAHRAMLALEEWLVGGAGVVATPILREGSGEVGGGKGKSKSKGGKNSKPKAEPRSYAVVEVNWAALVPRTIGMDTGALSPVVPSSIIAGEISDRKASRDESREKLESLTDAGERDRLFPGGSVTIDLSGFEAESREDAAKAAEAAAVLAKAKADDEAKAKAADEAKAKAKADEEAKAKAAADDEAKVKAAEAAKAKAKAEEEAKAKADEEAKAKADEEAKAKAKAADEAKAKAKAEEAKAKAKADEEAKAKAKAEDEAKAKAKAEEAKAKAKVEEAKANAKADEEAKAKAKANAKADQEAKAKAKAKADQEATAKADQEAKAKAKADADAAAAATDEEPRPPGQGGRARRERRASGELPIKQASVAPAVAAGPSILIEDVIQTASDATAVVAAAMAVTAKPGPVAEAPRRGREVDQVRTDAHSTAAAIAVSFSDDEEAFFRAGHEPSANAPSESFEDLDDGYQPQKFWDRVLGRRPPARPARRAGGTPRKK